MKLIYSNIPLALGDLINIKAFLDPVKDQYGFIRLTFHRRLLEEGVKANPNGWEEKRQQWETYLHDIGHLFFSEAPYILDDGQHQFRDTVNLIKEFGIQPRKPELAHLLCKGVPLNLGEEYVVITTKVREVSRNSFLPLSIDLWRALNKLAKKYKIVILGERRVEMRREYQVLNGTVFGIYEQIISNIPNDRIVDLTVPALGETVSNLSQIQQDCLVMNQAKCVITLGIGGNFVMSTAVAGMSIGWRTDNHWLAESVFNREYPNAIITKSWAHFIRVLESYAS